jgi:hypothetical protein
MDLYSPGPTTPSTNQEVKKLLRRLVETAAVLAPAEQELPISMSQVRDLRDVATSIGLVKRLKAWADSLLARQPVVLHLPGDDRQQEGSPGYKAQVMPAAAKKTKGPTDGGQLPKPEPYPVSIERMAPEVAELLRPPAPAARPEERLPSRESLNDNEYSILRELRDKHPCRILVVDLATATKIGAKVCKKIVSSLIKRGLAERPTKRGGATITPAGEALLDAANRPSVKDPLTTL